MKSILFQITLLVEALKVFDDIVTNFNVRVIWHNLKMHVYEAQLISNTDNGKWNILSGCLNLREQHIFLGHRILTGFAQFWKVFEVGVVFKMLLGPIHPWKDLNIPLKGFKIFPTMSIPEPKAKLVCMNVGRIFKYNCRSTVVSQSSFWLFIHCTVHPWN